MKHPNFFIVGAPKCGTTSLAFYLGDHPNCFMSNPKEPLFFSSDMQYPHPKTPHMEKYLEYFEGANESHLAVGEASTNYIFSPAALRNIYEFDPNAKIIAMLRNPVDMIYSYHLYRVNRCQETVLDFAKVWAMQETRKNGQKIPKDQPKPLWYYPMVGRLGDHVERIFNVFPREQVKIIFFDEFNKETQRVYKEVLDFLGLPQYEKAEFERYNAYAPLKWRQMQYVIDRIGPNFGPIVQGLKKMLGIKRLGFLNGLRRLNTASHEKEPLPPELRQQMNEEFRADVAKLSRILNRDLSHWQQ